MPASTRPKVTSAPISRGHARSRCQATNTQAALSAYQGAKGNLASVLSARRNELDVAMQRVDLEMQTARVWAQLNYLVPHDHANNQQGTNGGAP